MPSSTKVASKQVIAINNMAAGITAA